MKQPKFTDADRYPRGYTPAAATDIRATFARAVREMDENYSDQCDPLDPSTWSSDEWDKRIDHDSQ